MIVRRILGTLAGVVASTLTIMAIEAVGHELFDVPADLNAISLPLTFVLFAWTAGALVGGLVGIRLAQWKGAAWVVAFLVVSGVIATAFALPQPWWLTAGGLVLPLLAAWLVSRGAGSGDQRVAL